MGVEEEFDIGRDAAPLAVHWYVVCGIVVASVAFLVGVSACAYRWYQHRSAHDVNNRLSSAIKKGIKESGSSMRKSPSLRSTTSAKSSSSTRSSRSSGVGGSGALPPQGQEHQQQQQHYQGTSPTGHQLAKSPSRALDPAQMKAEYIVENEENKALLRKSPTEKCDTMKEKTEEELKANKLGSLQFAVEYDHQKTALVVTIIRAADLPAKDPNIGSSDPYVKLQLLPEKRHKVKTRVLRKTLNPVYDEIFTFYGIDFNQLQGVTLHFVVLSFDRFSRDDIIGEVIYPLAGLDFAEKETVTMMKPISPRHIKIHSQGRGELLVSLCYQPAANRLTVVVLKARNLPKMDITGLSDPYVKVYLLYNGQRIAKKKTHVKKRTLNPVFNESFLFDVPCNEGLQNVSLEFMVLDWDRMTKNEVVGRLELGSKFGGQETHHWNEVMNCPRKQIAEWHKLKE